MYQGRFCGMKGPRTIFTIDAVHAYCIENYSYYDTGEMEVLFRPLSFFQVKLALKNCNPKFKHNGKGGFPDQVALTQIVQEEESDSD